MKTAHCIAIWLAGFCALVSLNRPATAAEAPLTFIIDPVEPVETGSLMYSLVGAESGALPGTARLWFGLKISNNSNVPLHLNKIQATLITGGIPIVHVFARDEDIPANQTVSGGLFDLQSNETITLPLPAPVSVVISVFCDGYDPNNVQRVLAAYVPPTPNGQYLYPADEGDIGPEEYFSGGTHLPPHGQRWGTDWSVHRVISQGDTSTVRAGGDASVNEDRLGWGVPIRAIADGIVLRTSTGWINNPRPGVRAFQMMAEYDGEAISDVKVTRLGPTQPGVERAASLVRLPAGTVQLTIWDLAQQSRQILRRGSSVIDPAELVTHMALDALTGSRVVASVRLANGTHRLKVWDVSADGLTVADHTHLDDIAVSEVSLMKLSNTRVASGVRTAGGDLRVAVFSVGNSVQLLDDDTAGAATSIATATPSSTRVAIALRTAAGALKTIVWDLAGSGPYTLTRRGEATAENVSRVVAANNDGGKWFTAFRTSPGGILKLARWSASGDGMTLTPELVTPAHAIQNAPIAIAPSTGSAGTIHAVTASIIAGGTFQINGWGDSGDDNAPAEASASNTGATATELSLDETDDLFFIAGTRTAAGNLKIATWNWASGGGNSVYVLHGNCRVLYAHFQAGSVNTSVIFPGATVSAGQVLGRMGNSGSSGGPHTHIHSDRVHPITDITNMLALEAAGNLPTIGARPIPFSGARAMRLSEISPGGEGNAANSFATLNGQVMFDTAFGIRPRLNTRYLDKLATGQNPTGRKEVVPGAPATGGPYRTTVAQAVGAASAGTRLYIRGGNYNEAVTLNKRMTLRRYDYYDTAGSVVINP